MSAAMEDIRRTERLWDDICNTLEDHHVSGDEFQLDKEKYWTELEKLSNSKKNYISNDLNTEIDGPQKMIIASFYDNPEQFLDLLEKKVDELSPDLASELNSLLVIFIVRDIKSRFLVEKFFDRKRRDKLKSKLKQKKENRRSNVTIQQTYIFSKEYSTQDVELENDWTTEMMLVPPLSGYSRINLEGPFQELKAPKGVELPEALMVSLPLFELVKLYSLIGDQLFKGNVRYGVAETMGVDRSIQQTLDREPWYFWYKNNGVTILVEDEKFHPTCSEKLRSCTNRSECGKMRT